MDDEILSAVPTYSNVTMIHVYCMRCLRSRAVSGADSMATVGVCREPAKRLCLSVGVSIYAVLPDIVATD